MNSHIQMPKLMLKRFENEQHELYYYDVCQQAIRNKGHAKSINTKEGYYSDDTEEYLEQNIETPFSKLLQIIDGIDLEDAFAIRSIAPHKAREIDEIVKNFVYALISRAPSMIKEIDSHACYLQFLPEQDKRNSYVRWAFSAGKEKDPFSSFRTSFTINQTEHPFVLPVCGLYEPRIKGGIDYISLPISPKVTFSLIPKQLIEAFGTIPIFVIERKEEVYIYNKSAFDVQKSKGWGYIVAPTRDALEELI